MKGGWWRSAALAAVLAPSLALVSTGPPAGGAEVTVNIVDFGFSPTSVTVSPGALVTWTYTTSGQARHTVTADDGSFTSGALQPGRSFRRVFSAAAAGTTITYHCAIHPGQMRGEVVVAPLTTTVAPLPPPTTLPVSPTTSTEPPPIAPPLTLVEDTTTTTASPPTSTTTTTTQPSLATSEPPAVNPFDPGGGTGESTSAGRRTVVPFLLAGIGGVLAAIAAVGRRLYQERLTRPGQ